ncbi:hypothetical protein DL96DRAFT_1454802 [Flagelloscypha sp. PMI_526]|nr:hypothetical protein DL96DRAFT_1454802 [Flagelloscypha sp. PMI_526]
MSASLSDIVNSTNASPIAPLSSLPSPSPPLATSSSKRKHDDGESSDTGSQAKIRRIDKQKAQPEKHAVRQLFQICAEHPAVAQASRGQKSYGSEKRFLCPPPFIRIEGAPELLRSQQLTMTVVAETGERSPPQKASLDSLLHSSFKFLHVTGTAKAKAFNLTLELSEPLQSSSSSHTASDDSSKDLVPGRIWASFESAPVAIISKPSKKTAKARSIASCILEGGPVSLFNRINSQTVRTKYMVAENDSLHASSNSWSAFNVNVIRRPPGTSTTGPQPVTYGCEVVLSDARTGLTTPPLVIRKIDKAKVSKEDGGPVSQMQKIVLQRVNEDGSNHYLSAQAPDVAGAPQSPSSSQLNAASHPLVYGLPRLAEEIQDGVLVVSDEVDDYLVWTIVGISKFQYTFFDAFGEAGTTIPRQSLTPFPTLFTTPVYRAPQNTVELTVSNFFYEDPTTKAVMPLDVYLGNLGPLKHRVYQAGPANVSGSAPFVQQLGGSSGNALAAPDPAAVHYASMHTIVIVEMPSLKDITDAIDQDVAAAEAEARADQTASMEEDSETIPPFTDRSLPLLFVRRSDGLGYHSGRSIACDAVPPQPDGSPAVPPILDSNWQTLLPDPLIPGGQWAMRIM